MLGTLVGEGGEAEVFEVIGKSDLVVKRMRETPSPEIVQRWIDMLSLEPPSKHVNWPVDIWIDAWGTYRGLLLKKVESVSAIHGIYNPGTRIERFSEATAKDLVRIALDLSRVVAQVHQRGWVIGDLNPTNVLLDKGWRVHVIDSDSIQLDAHGRRHACHVGHPLFLAPEWQGKGLRDSDRSPASDVFSLAVQVYHLLHFGRHPFAGIWNREGESPTVEEAVISGWYVHGTSSPLQPPKMSLSPSVWGEDLVLLFRNSFAVNPAQRPLAREWATTLGWLHSEMRRSRCGQPGHVVKSSAVGCCWCDFALQGADFFAPDALVQESVTLDKTTSMLHVLLGRLQPKEVPGNFESVFGQIERPSEPLFVGWRWRRSERKAIARAREEEWQRQLDAWLLKRDAWNRHQREVITENEFRRLKRKRILQAMALLEEMRELSCRTDMRLRFELELAQIKLEPGVLTDIGTRTIQKLNEAGVSNALVLSKRTLRHVDGVGHERTRILLAWRQRLLRSISSPGGALSQQNSKRIIAGLCQDALKSVARLKA